MSKFCTWQLLQDHFLSRPHCVANCIKIKPYSNFLFKTIHFVYFPFKTITFSLFPAQWHQDLDENTNTCFHKIKSQLQKALLRPLRYYGRSKPVTLQCDASLKGLGGLHHPVMNSPLLLQASPSWTLSPIMPTSREKTWPSYIVSEKIPHIPVWKDIHHGDGP